MIYYLWAFSDCLTFTKSAPLVTVEVIVVAASEVSKRETSRSYFSAACECCLWARVKWNITAAACVGAVLESRLRAGTQCVDSSLPFSATCWVASAVCLYIQVHVHSHAFEVLYGAVLAWLRRHEDIFESGFVCVFFIVLCTTFFFTLSKQSSCSVLTQRHSWCEAQRKGQQTQTDLIDCESCLQKFTATAHPAMTELI